MKKKQGFTLIELLAVIVILAVIALIATPIIMNVINDSKKGAAKDAMYGYVKAVELACAKAITPTTDAPDGDYITTDGNLKNGNETIMINFKGTKPKDNGTVTLSKGNVTHATLDFDGIPVEYDGKSATTGESGSSTPSNNPIYELGTEIYYNPETNTKCSSSEVNTTDNAKTGCLKWNTIVKTDSADIATIDIMLDHNTTGHVAWVSKEDYLAAGGTEAEYETYGNNNKGPITVTKQLQTDVATWNSSIKSTVRLISGEEVANIGEDSAWNDGYYTGTVYTKQAWLSQNLSYYNTNAKPYGYWTSTARSSSSNFAWNVYYDGSLNYNNVGRALNYGVRPVVTISKSVFS